MANKYFFRLGNKIKICYSRLNKKNLLQELLNIKNDISILLH